MIGSYGKRTAIAPPSDIDVIFKMPYSEYKRYDDYSGNGQSQLLQDIKNKLKTRYPTTSIRGDGPVVVINFNSYKIELIPAFILGDGYYLPHTRNGGSWERTEPKKEMDNIIQSNKRSEGNTVKLIKMIKAWKTCCNVPIKSLVIELTVINFLKSYEYYNKSTMYYDWMVRDYFDELIKNVNSSCIIPGTYENLPYGNKWESKAKTALNNAKKAIENEKYPYTATGDWKKIFGIRFKY